MNSAQYFLGHWTMSILLLWSSSQEVQVHSSTTSASVLGLAINPPWASTSTSSLPLPLPTTIWMETSPCVLFDLLQAILCVAKCAAAASCLRRSPLYRVLLVDVVGIWGMKLKERKKKFYYARACKKRDFLYENIFETDCAVRGRERGREIVVDSYGVRLGPACLLLLLLAQEVLDVILLFWAAAASALMMTMRRRRWPSASARPPACVVSFGLGENCGNKNRIQCRFLFYFFYIYFVPQLRYRRRSWWCLRFLMMLLLSLSLSGHHHSYPLCCCSPLAACIFYFSSA